MLVVPGIMSAISMVWFMIGGIIDIRKLSQALATQTEDDLGNGRIEGNVSLSDRNLVEAAERKSRAEWWKTAVYIAGKTMVKRHMARSF